MIVYDQPVPGLDELGNEIICNQQVSVTREDAILIQRRAYKKLLEKRKEQHLIKQGQKFCVYDIPAQMLLDEYTLVHWASTYEDKV